VSPLILLSDFKSQFCDPFRVGECLKLGPRVSLREYTPLNPGLFSLTLPGCFFCFHVSVFLPCPSVARWHLCQAVCGCRTRLSCANRVARILKPAIILKHWAFKADSAPQPHPPVTSQPSHGHSMQSDRLLTALFPQVNDGILRYCTPPHQPTVVQRPVTRWNWGDEKSLLPDEIVRPTVVTGRNCGH